MTGFNIPGGWPPSEDRMPAFVYGSSRLNFRLCMVVALSAALWLFLPKPEGPRSAIVPLAIGASALLLGVHRRSIHRQVRSKVRETGGLLCWNCGQDLRGAAEPNCPKCGATFSKDGLPVKWHDWAPHT